MLMCSVQAVNTSFASPVAQRQASREVFGSGSDGEDTTFGMPYSPGTLPTVEEEGSQELTSESFEDHKKPGGAIPIFLHPSIECSVL